MNDEERFEIFFGDVCAVMAEGARVGFISCRECGAVVLIDPRDEFQDYARKHIKWHEEMVR